MNIKDQIRAKVLRLIDELGEQRDVNLEEILSFIDSLQEQPDRLEEAAINSWIDYGYHEPSSCCYIDGFIAGAKWQKEQMAKETPDAELDGTRWLGWRKATKKLNEANCGIHFFGNLFPYLRKKGELDGLCRKNGREWEYDTDGIIKKARANKFNYK